MRTFIPITMMLFPFSGTAICDDPESKDFTKVEPSRLSCTAVTPKKDPKTGFVVGGTNTTKLIKSLTEINGIAIADLERAMRPSELSRAGLLGKEERLLEVLAADNEWVVKSGLTHQELARHLIVLAAIGRRESGAFRYYGVRFKARFKTRQHIARDSCESRH